MERKKSRLSVRQIALFAMLGSLMFCQQVALEALPNIHLTGMFVLLLTATFRRQALIPIYLYVFLIGVRWGFGIAWLPYLYIWLPLWAGAMLLPRKMSRKTQFFVYPALGLCHGLFFGTLYAPAQALLFGLNFRQTLAWIGAGLVFDLVHGVGNVAVCTLVPLLRPHLARLAKWEEK